MKPREQFHDIMNFRKPSHRFPMVEWAYWWEKTHERWQQEGLPADLSRDDLWQYFGLDEFVCLLGMPRSGIQPPYHGGPIIANEEEYEALKPQLFSDDHIRNVKEQAEKWTERHRKGEVIVRLWLDGFFWFPRTLLGIENHLYSFYDQPELLHRMCGDLSEFNIRVMEELFPLLTPDMVGFGEDMSYNNGPMLSYAQFTEFLLPYYNKIVPYIKDRGITCWVDTDGDVSLMIPWLLEAGIQGIYPLERQAGVDVAKIREEYPKLLMFGAYDKMVMSKGEEAMRSEFERLLPVMKKGGFMPSVDHQTPPGVSLENYKTYIRLYEEYCIKAAN